ncbi:MAG: FecR family protein [Flavobacteriaceae bacterium]
MKTLIIKFLTDTITDEEMVRLKNWLKDSKHQELFESYVKTYFSVNHLLQEPDVDSAYDKVWGQIQSTHGSTKKLFPKWLQYAAIFTGLLITVYGTYLFMTTQKDSVPEPTQVTLEMEDGSLKILDENVTEIITDTKGGQMVHHQQNKLVYKDSISSDTENLTYNQLTVPYGKKFQLMLSDGTHVFLNSGSKIKYPVTFLPNKARDVFLDGEAYFTVAKSKHQPFTVISNEMKTVVLGTQFNVSNYKNEGNSSTVLVEGSVMVQGLKQKETTQLRPGQRITLTDNHFAVDEVNIEKHIAWTKNQLFFVNDYFGLIIKELERHFNVEIRNTDESLNKKLFTGTFETETLEEILTAFQIHSDFEYQIMDNGGTIIIETTK